MREKPIALSATSTSQRTAPDLASSATRCASSVPTNTVDSRIATPRFTPREADVEHVGPHLGRPCPQPLSGARIQRGDGARRFGHVHDAIGHDRGRFDEPVVHLVGPYDPQISHVPVVDLVQLRKPVGRVVARVGEPALRPRNRLRRGVRRGLGRWPVVPVPRRARWPRQRVRGPRGTRQTGAGGRLSPCCQISS